MTSSSNNLQRPKEEILDSPFHQRSFDNNPPMAMNYNHYNTSETHHYQSYTSQFQRQDLYNGNRSIPYRHHHHHHPHHQLDTPRIPLQDIYTAPPLQVSKFSFLAALNLAREKKKWLLINIQAATVPECGILNQEIWGDPDIADIISQSFVFLQLNHNDVRAEAYFGKYYGFLYVEEDSAGILYAGNNRETIIQLPHIALLDPVSGYRWKVWEGPGLPDKERFLADMSEYEMVGEGDWCERGKGVIRESDWACLGDYSKSKAVSTKGRSSENGDLDGWLNGMGLWES